MAADADDASKKWRMEWTEPRKIALLKQVIDCGPKAFKTFKDGNSKDGDKHTQAHAWTNKTDGILTLTLLDENFREFGDMFPSPYTSVLSSLKRWLKEGAHLYTQGKEQRDSKAPQCNENGLLATHDVAAAQPPASRQLQCVNKAAEVGETYAKADINIPGEVIIAQAGLSCLALQPGN